MPVVDTEELDVFAHDKWKDVANVENQDVTPQLVVEPSLLDFGKIGSVILLKAFRNFE